MLKGIAPVEQLVSAGEEKQPALRNYQGGLMSIHGVEKAFWTLGKDPDAIGQLKADPELFLAQFVLSESERKMIRENDLKSLADQGVNTLLTLMVWPMFNGPDGMPFDYLTHMNGGVPVEGMEGVAPEN